MTGHPPPAGDWGRRHLLFGWWSLLAFASLGLFLEMLHGLKVGAYLDASNDTRRLMWTLAHAHGALLGLVHIAFALTVRAVPGRPAWNRLISRSLVGASILLPGGFFLGGVQFYAGDPGLGVLVVPIGAMLLIAAAALTARSVARADAATEGRAARGRKE